MSKLRTGFSEKSDQPAETKQVLNYIWINREPFESSAREEYCLPERYIENIKGTARCYPETTIFLWLDQDETLLSAKDVNALKAELADCQNIEIKNLRGIEEYANYDLFEPGRRFKRSNPPPVARNPNKVYPETVDLFWARVDLARIIVLKHCLEDLEADSAVYSDIDIRDARLENERLQGLLDQYGLACSAGEVFMLGDIYFEQPSTPCIENGYIAATNMPENISFLNNIIEATKDDLGQKESFFPAYSGYKIFQDHMLNESEKRANIRSGMTFCCFRQPLSQFSDPSFCYSSDY